MQHLRLHHWIKAPHKSSSGSDFEASLESFKRKAKQNKGNSGNDASGAFAMPVSKKKKVSKAYDPKRLNRTDYSNPAGILDAYLTKTNISNDKNIIQSSNKALQGKIKVFKRPENISTSTATITTNNQCQAQVSRTASSRKTYPHPSNIRRKKKKKRLKSGVNDSDGNYLDDSDSDSDELTSVLNMRKDVKLEYHKGLGSVLKKHVFVGIVDDDYSLIQYETEAVHTESLYFGRGVLLSNCSFQFQLLLQIGNSFRPKIKDLISIGLDMDDMKVVTMTQEKKSQRINVWTRDHDTDESNKTSDARGLFFYKNR